MITFKKLKLLGRSVTVSSLPEKEMPAAWGTCQPLAQAIKITSNMVLESEQHVVLHEILHMYDDILGIKLKHEAIDPLAFAIVDMIQNNPKLVDYLRGR